MLQAATRRAQRALMLSRLVAGGEGAGFPRCAATGATAPPPPQSATTTPPPYSPPQTPAFTLLREFPVPTLNFWESPMRPGQWKISHQWWFLGGAGTLSACATVKALSADNNKDEEEGDGRNGGSKVSGGLSSAKQSMIAEQARSPVKKQVP